MDACFQVWLTGWTDREALAGRGSGSEQGTVPGGSTDHVDD
jgi:hypothetical protein